LLGEAQGGHDGSERLKGGGSREVVLRGLNVSDSSQGKEGPGYFPLIVDKAIGWKAPAPRDNQQVGGRKRRSDGKGCFGSLAKGAINPALDEQNFGWKAVQEVYVSRKRRKATPCPEGGGKEQRGGLGFEGETFPDETSDGKRK